MYPQPSPSIPSTWAFDPFLQAQFRGSYYTPQFGGYYTPQADVPPSWHDDPWAAWASFGAIGGGALVRSEDEAVRSMADLFERAGNAGNTPPAVRAQLLNKATMYREAANAGAYDRATTRVAIGDVAFRSAAHHDKRIYDKIIDRWTRGAQQMRQYGAPAWAEVLDSEIDRITGRSREVQEATWEAAAEQTAADTKRTTGLSLAVLLPIALLAGGIWLAVALAPTVVTLKSAYGR